MINLILDNLPLILSTLFGSGSFYAYWIERGRREAETKQANSDALKSMQQAYDTFTKDSLEKYNKLELEVEKLENKVKTLNEDILNEKNKYIKLELAYNKLKIDYNSLNESYKTIKRDFEKYNKKNK